jgi:glycosyltransferase involved in cell wall biosynthesis
MDKKVSVIVNCYNGEKYLNNCILSIINQKYKNLELIFFDNSSSDNSKKIINQYQDSRIRYFYSDTKLPLYSARNEAIQKSTGSLIAFLDVDDWWDENYLLSKKEFFNDTSLDYFYSNVLIYYEKENKYTKYNKFYLPNGKIYKYLANNYFIIISGLIIKKIILEKENYFNKDYNIIGDYDLVMRISKYAKAKSFNEPLIFYRVHDNNFSKLNNKIYYYEYKDWFYRQKKINDYDFQINEKKLLLKLNKLDIIYHLYENKNFNLLIKIIKFPILIMKLKFLFSFFLPMKLVNYFRK